MYYQHTDALGSPVAQTDAARAVVATSTYLPFGGLHASTGNGNQPGPGYANQYADSTGLIYMRVRYYDPVLHRFISPDPQGLDTATAINFNRYAYANNSPYRFYDPSGRDAEDIEDPSGCYEAPDLCPSGSPLLAGITEVRQNIGEGVKIADDVAMTAVETAALAVVPVVGEIKEAQTAIRVVKDVRAAAMARGRVSEARVLEDMGLAKNTQLVTTEEGSAIPDALTASKSIEIKDTKKVTLTKQIRIQTDAAKQSERESQLITGENTCVSENCENAFDTIIRRDDIGPSQ